jgi:hypothetical protein
MSPPKVNFGICLNITYVVSMATKFSLAPKHVHCNAIQRIFKYLKATSNLSICSIRNGIINIVTTYYDVDYIIDLDDHESHIGFILSMNEGPIAWGSQKQPYSSSITKTKYITKAIVTKQVI